VADTAADRLRQALEHADFGRRAEYERVTEELSFCRELAALHPGELPDGPRRLDAAQARALAGRALGEEAFVREVRGIEADLADFGRVAKTYSIYGVGHAHIDMNWQWSWTETVTATHDTFATMLRLMELYPEFVFSQSQASCYDIVRRHNPAMLERVRQRVREGRWEVVASHWVENDSNMAGPEALAQHVGQTRRFMAEHLGLRPEDVPVNWAPDTFTGHAARVPSYLAAAGVKYQYSHRIGTFGPHHLRAFWWEAEDGARVLFYYSGDTRFWYNERWRPGFSSHLIEFAKQTGLRRWLVSYGVGDHGGGPTRRDLERARDMGSWPLFPRVELGRVRDYFEWLEKNGQGLPTVRGELQVGANGAFTGMAYVKKANRIAENRLADAQLAGATAGAAARRHDHDMPAWPADLVREGWQDTLLGHFHDILPGCCVRDSRAHHHGLFQKTLATATVAELHALRAFSLQVAPALPDQGDAGRGPGQTPSLTLRDAMGGGVGFGQYNAGLWAHGNGKGTASPLPGAAGAPDGDGVRRFVLHNPTAFDLEETVELTIWENAEAWVAPMFREREFDVHFADGSPPVRAQKVLAGDHWWHDFVTLVFPARVPALGWAAVAVRDTTLSLPGAPAPAGPARVDIVRPEGCSGVLDSHHEGLENERIRLMVDSRTGALRELLDKRSGLVLAAEEGPAPALEFRYEMAHPGSAWGLGHMRPPEPVACLGFGRPRQGPLAGALECRLALGAAGRSEMALTYELRAGEPFVRMRLKGLWLERGKDPEGSPILRWRLPARLEGARAVYEVAFGFVERPYRAGEEMPGLEWAAVRGRAGGREAGVAVSTDGKYGYSLDGSALRVSLLRAAYDPDPLPDLDFHDMSWRVEPFAGLFRPETAYRSARHLTHEPRAIPSGLGRAGGPVWPATGRHLKVTGGVLCGVEPAGEAGGLALRAYEVEGLAQPLVLDFEGSPLGRVRKAETVDLNNQALAPASVSGQRVEVPQKAKAITAVRVWFA